uniref:FAR1 DNA binding domain, zinc finger, SWIM-type, MULE transposase domain, FHY3/FAR1 family n=1 Tax=Tanacetum cinerariifolium TaxID=118510 RepID=A0A6L2MH19_TANCI|nr:FAR1 DNA binding domain, zinc finger, SWIM-type, MULE transposase domain, FHY3/FAR1 family [Tanacetum cinerariifolium]
MDCASLILSSIQLPINNSDNQVDTSTTINVDTSATIDVDQQQMVKTLGVVCLTGDGKKFYKMDVPDFVNPLNGKLFKTLEDALHFYKSYVKLSGFEARKSTEYKRKDGKVKLSGLLLLALMWLKELLTVYSQSPHKMREIEDILSKSLVEDASQDMHDNECGREELFITKTLKPLLSKFLHAKFFHEVKIMCDISKMTGCNIIGTWAIHIMTLKTCFTRSYKDGKQN